MTEIDKSPYTTTDIEFLDEMLRRTTFLLMYSHVEEWLFHVWKTYARNVKLDCNEGSIARFKPVLKTLGVDLSNDNWGLLRDAEKVRNCLLHANGRISLMKPEKREEIERIVQKRNDLLAIKGDRLYIEGEFLNKFQSAAEVIINVNVPPTTQQ